MEAVSFPYFANWWILKNNKTKYDLRRVHGKFGQITCWYPRCKASVPLWRILDPPRKFTICKNFPGCVGTVSALAHILGEETCKLYSLVKQGKAEEAKKLQQRLVAPNAAVSPYFHFM